MGRKKLLGLLVVVSVVTLLLGYKQLNGVNVNILHSVTFDSSEFSWAILGKEKDLPKALQLTKEVLHHHSDVKSAGEIVHFPNEGLEKNQTSDDLLAEVKERPHFNHSNKVTLKEAHHDDKSTKENIKLETDPLVLNIPTTEPELDLNDISTEDQGLSLNNNDSSIDDGALLSPCPHIEDSVKNSGWKQFKTSLDEYAIFHKQQLEQLRTNIGRSNVRTLTYICEDPTHCFGLGDQFYRIQQVLMLAVATNRVLLLHWNAQSMKTFHHLLPNQIEWNYFDQTIQKSYKEYPIVKSLNNKEEYIRFMDKASGNDQLHIRVSTALPVPFGKGMNRFLHHDYRNMFRKLSLYEMFFNTKHPVSVTVISGVLLRYLFTFSQDVLKKVEEAQKKMGIFEKPYVGVHIRTGFYGTEIEEVGHFSRMKIFRTSDLWTSTIKCSIHLADASLSSSSSLYLATDSYLVKQLAARDFGNRVRSLNMTLQHVAIVKTRHKRIDLRHKSENEVPRKTEFSESPEVQSISNLSGVDGYLATWIDFLLLARSSILVHSISGFSTVAGQYCSVRTQYYTPKCTKRPYASLNS